MKLKSFLLYLLPVLWGLLISESSWALQSSFPDKYDFKITKACKRFLPGVDCRLYKAQLFQESRLDPNAVSPVGARGLAQFMPATWAEVSEAIGQGNASPHMVSPAINAGAYYMARLRRTWRIMRPDADRHSLALASYNAGLGNMLKAQSVCNEAVLYSDIVECLPSITGHHSDETKTYVKRIWRYFTRMLVGG